MPKRVMVFIDYQNMYRGARRAFHDHRFDPHFYGQVDPVKLATYLTHDADDERELVGVRIYRGIPSSGRDPRGYSAARKQNAAWGRDPLTEVVARPLRYPEGWPDSHAPGERPQEKGIDVALAMDFAVMGLEKRYDVGIMFSADTDLKPALEYIVGKTRAWGAPRAEVAAWRSPHVRSGRLSISGTPKPYCHWIDEERYELLRDNTDYTPE